MQVLKKDCWGWMFGQVGQGEKLIEYYRTTVLGVKQDSCLYFCVRGITAVNMVVAFAVDY